MCCAPTAIAPKRPCSISTRSRRRAPSTCGSATSRCARPRTRSSSCAGSTGSRQRRARARRGIRRRSRPASCVRWPRPARCLPNSRHLVLRPNHRIPFLTAKCLCKCRNIRERPIDAPALGCVGIDRHPRAELLGAHVHAPTLRVTKEIPLLRRVALEQTRSAVTRQRLLERVEPHEQTSPVGDVLALRELAVHMEGVDLDVLVELAFYERRLLDEVRRVGGLPPVAQVALGVVVPAFVIEAVGQLVSCPAAAQRAVVRGIVRLRVERLWRERTGGEYHLVL